MKIRICKNCHKEFTHEENIICSRECLSEYRKTSPNKGNFKKGHQTVYTEATRKKIALSKIGSLNVNWKGNEVGYDALHAWVKRRLNKPDYCCFCHQKRKLDLANISQEYKRDLSDWEWLCRKCHMTKDGRLEKLPSRYIIKFGKDHFNWKGGKPRCLVCNKLLYNYDNKFCKTHFIQSKQKILGQYDKSGNLIEKFRNRKEANKLTKISISSINNTLIGRSKSAGGFIWRYE